MTVRFAPSRTPSSVLSHAKRGDLVVVLLGGANRDPAQFDEPDALDPTRANAQTHLSFGAGIHYCLGAALARLEGAIAIGALLRRLPRLTAPSPTRRSRGARTSSFAASPSSPSSFDEARFTLTRHRRRAILEAYASRAW